MPAAVPVIATVAGSIGAAGGIAGVSFFGLTGISAIAATAASTFVLSTLQNKLGARPPSPNQQSFAAKASSLTQQIKQPITGRRLVYGEVRVSGPLVFASSTDDNKYLHLVIALAGHEIEEIGEIWLNDDSIPADALDGSGNVTSGKFDGLVRIKKHLGTTSQNADSDLVSEVSEWTTNHRLQGIAYIYVRLKFDRDVFPTGIPNVSAWIKGKKLLDPRTSTTLWSPNIALMGHDYLTDSSFGLGADSADIDESSTNSAANICEEFVTTQDIDLSVADIDTSTNTLTLGGDRLEYQTGDNLRLITSGTAPSGLATGTDYYVIIVQRKDTPRIKLASSLANALNSTEVDITSDGSGAQTLRKIAEPRYFGGGVIESETVTGDNLRDLLSGMGGKAVYVGGSWKLLAAAYRTPTITLDEDHLRAPLKVQTKVSRKERFNTVKGVYISPLNDGQPSDYPPISNSTYKSNDDGTELISELDLPFTQRPHTAQRLAKIKLEQHRQEIVVEYPANLHALQLQAGDTMMINNDRMGWSGKIFEVQGWKLAVEDKSDSAPIFGVDLVLQETVSTVYDWSSGEETTIDPAPNTNLPNASIVEVVTGFSLDSILISTRELDRIYSVRASWDISDNEFVASGGQYEIEFKETTESIYKSVGRVDGNVTEMILPALKPDVLYDVRIFAFNNLGVRSAATEINNFSVGSTVTTDSEDWESETLGRSGSDWESDTLTSEDWET